MEFFLTLAALYGAQCFLKLDRHEMLGISWRFPSDRHDSRTWMIRGPGWRLLHPWPAAFVFTGRLQIPLDRNPTGISELRGTIESAYRDTRALRWLSSLQLVWVLLFGPIAAMTIGAESTLLLGMGPALALHLSGILLLFRAQRKVHPDAPNLGEQLAIAALYPPALIRSGAEIVRRRVADRHFIELAAVVLREPEFENLVRREIGRAKSPLHSSTRSADDIHWLIRVAASRSLDLEALTSPRARDDPNAASYCESCGGDYVDGYRFCGECQLTTTKYPTPSVED